MHIPLTIGTDNQFQIDPTIPKAVRELKCLAYKYSEIRVSVTRAYTRSKPHPKKNLTKEQLANQLKEEFKAIERSLLSLDSQMLEEMLYKSEDEVYDYAPYVQQLCYHRDRGYDAVRALKDCVYYNARLKYKYE